MIRVDPKKLKPYGDRIDDGIVQMSFTFAMPASVELKEAAKIYVEKLGFEKVAVATMEKVGENFTSFVVYGHARPTIDFTRVTVPKLEFPEMDYHSLTEFMEKYVDKPIVVVGGATGSDAHTVGIDAILNMKGFAGDYGLERYPKFKVYNLRSQLTNEELINKAIELKADAILISQIVTQRDSHIQNLKEFKSVIDSRKAELGKDVLKIIGGPRLNHDLALKLGFDAGFGTGTLPSQVASFIVHDYLNKKGIKINWEKELEADLKTKEVLKTPYDDVAPKIADFLDHGVSIKHTAPDNNNSNNDYKKNKRFKSYRNRSFHRKGTK